MKERSQIRGDNKNPYHLSVGGVLIDKDQVYLIRKQDSTITLPRETMYSDESVHETVIRGFREEVGINITVEKFLGSLTTHFYREDGTKIEKTTLYFLVNFLGSSTKDQADDEMSDEIILLKPTTAIEELKSQGNEEYLIIHRTLLSDLKVRDTNF